MKLFSSALLLRCFLVVARAPQMAEATRTVDVRLTRYEFSPERIDVQLGERVRLNVVSVDGPHGFQVKALGLNVRLSARGKTASVDITPTETGRFEITCSEYCGRGHGRMKAWLVVTSDARNAN